MRLPRVALALLILVPGLAQAEPIRLEWAVEVTTRQNLLTGVVQSIDPIDFVFGMTTSLYDSHDGYFGQPTEFSAIPMADTHQQPPVVTGDSWIGYAGSLATAVVRGTNAFHRGESALIMQRTVAAASIPNSPPTIHDYANILTSGDVSFRYTTFNPILEDHEWVYTGIARAIAVPEPSVVLLLSGGLLLALGRRRHT
jgi:hypothetical protein